LRAAGKTKGIFIWRKWQELKIREIAETCRCRWARVKSRMHAAVTRLRENFGTARSIAAAGNFRTGNHGLQRWSRNWCRNLKAELERRRGAGWRSIWPLAPPAAANLRSRPGRWIGCGGEAGAAGVVHAFSPGARGTVARQARRRHQRDRAARARVACPKRPRPLTGKPCNMPPQSLFRRVDSVHAAGWR